MNRFKTCPTCKGFFTTENGNIWCSPECKEREVKIVVADSGTIGRNGKADGIVWSYVLVGHSNILLKHEKGYDFNLKTSPQGECLALIQGLEQLPRGWSGEVQSDCKYALEVVFKLCKDKKLNPELKRRRDALDLGEIKITLLDGHPSREHIKRGFGKRGNPVSEWNVLCDSTCTDLIQYIRENHCPECFKGELIQVVKERPDGDYIAKECTRCDYRYVF